MARTVWGAHKRYMETYLAPYKGYYVSEMYAPELGYISDMRSLLGTVLGVTTRATIGFVVV